MNNNKLNVVLAGAPSDSHMWNLIFMELFLQENGCVVRNLGPCVPPETIYQTLQEENFFDLVVISSINGHLFQDAIKVITSSPAHLTLPQRPSFVVGGKIGITETGSAFQKKKLIKLGYDDVFIESEDSLARFPKYLDSLVTFRAKNLLKYAV